jgi:hypothetical protein
VERKRRWACCPEWATDLGPITTPWCNRHQPRMRCELNTCAYFVSTAHLSYSLLQSTQANKYTPRSTHSRIDAPVRCQTLRYLSSSLPTFPTRDACSTPQVRGLHSPLNHQHDTRHASLAQAQPYQLRHRRWSARRRLSGGAVCSGEARGGEAAHE